MRLAGCGVLPVETAMIDWGPHGGAYGALGCLVFRPTSAESRDASVGGGIGL
jgi:hypothetical protein